MSTATKAEKTMQALAEIPRIRVPRRGWIGSIPALGQCARSDFFELFECAGRHTYTKSTLRPLTR